LQGSFSRPSKVVRPAGTFGGEIKIKNKEWCWQTSTTANAKNCPRLWGKSYGDFSVAFFTIGRNSTSCGR